MRDVLSHFIIHRYEFPCLPLSPSAAIENVVRKFHFLFFSFFLSRCNGAGSKKCFLHASLSYLPPHRPSLSLSFPRAKNPPFPLSPLPSTPDRIRCTGYDLSLKPVWRVDQMYPGALGLPVIKHPYIRIHTLPTLSIFPVKKRRHRCCCCCYCHPPAPPNDSKRRTSSGVTPTDRPQLGSCAIPAPVCAAGVQRGKVAPRVSSSDAVACGAGLCAFVASGKTGCRGRAGNGDGENSGKRKR